MLLDQNTKTFESNSKEMGYSSAKMHHQPCFIANLIAFNYFEIMAH
jgi:hypothetical protein